MRLAGGNSSKGWLTSSDEVLGPLGATFDNLVSLGRAAVAGVHGTFDSKGVTSIFPSLPSLPGTTENPFSKGMTICTGWTNYCPYLSDSEHLLFRKYIRHSSALKKISRKFMLVIITMQLPIILLVTIVLQACDISDRSTPLLIIFSRFSRHMLEIFRCSHRSSFVRYG